ncbi:hypothetical protein [Glycomyces dulcitolivorans]|uniref:hypothetical protein n=1 Tax=Glycomyces dulcitolivorans TaxID=2200759 RepID=UPI00130069CE|nr:hypothetical protein [Glycomyces dulcitolivorans]
MRTATQRLRPALSRVSKRAALMLAAVAIAVFALPSTAMADDYFAWCPEAETTCQTGVSVSAPQGACETAPAAYHKTRVCVVYDGDYVYVYDGQADGYSGMAEIGTDNGSVHKRFCRNTTGFGTWVRCNFDWAESGEHRMWAGYLISYKEMPTEFLWAWDDK